MNCMSFLFILMTIGIAVDTHLRLRFFNVVSMYLQCKKYYRYDIALDSVNKFLTVGLSAVDLRRATLHLDNCLI